MVASSNKFKNSSPIGDESSLNRNSSKIDNWGMAPEREKELTNKTIENEVSNGIDPINPSEIMQ